VAISAEDSLIAVGDHVVHVYDDDVELVGAVSRFFARALRSGGVAVVVATPQHHAAIRAAITASGIDLDAAAVAPRYHALDARETLATFTDHGHVDGGRFASVIGHRIRTAAATGNAVYVFGEMVALLWDDGDVAGALALETMWNELATTLPFALYCAYPHGAVDGEDQLAAIKDVCDRHGEVLTPARYQSDDSSSAGGGDDERTAFFVPVPLAARAVRRFVAESLAAWDLGAVIDDASVVASELATNALVHADSPFRVQVVRGDSTVRISVHDASTTPPAPRDMISEATNGRGMGLVAQLSERIGIEIGADGKFVWAELALAPTP
jgi:anti-sigma regulatory factor (Ser/Thr protein kinase)